MREVALNLSSESVSSETAALDTRTARLLGAAVTLWGVGLLMAIGFHRHLYGDAAWYLVRVLSENQVISLDPLFGQDFFRSRWFSYHVTQWPFFWASQLGVTNLIELSWLFGVGLYLPHALSLLVCWLWLKDKRLFLFPLASLFAGSINGEVYIVSEAHFLLSLVWPLFVLLLCADLTPARRVWLVVFAIPTLLAYETMAFFGPLLVIAAAMRARAEWTRRSSRVLFLLLAAYFALGALFAVMATVWPRDVSNLDTFVSGIPKALAQGHLGIAASIWLTLMFPIVVLIWPRHRTVSVGLLAAPIVLVAVYVARLFTDPQQVGFEPQIYARAMGMVTPVPLCFMLLALPFLDASRRQALVPCLRAVAIFGLLQGVWSLGATVLWANMVTVMRLELSRTAGVMPYQSSLLAQRAVRGMPMERLHQGWPLLPMSIVLGGSPDVSSVIFAQRYPFIPFNPYVASELPDLSRFGVRYTGLKAALDGGHLDFRPGGNAAPALAQGWSQETDTWAHWTDGTRATLRLRPTHDLAQGSELQLRVGAFVPPQHPRQRVTVSLNGRRLGTIELTSAQVADGPATIRLPVPADAGSCGDELFLQLDLPDAQSPKSLGLSEDFRRLGVAMVELWLIPNS
jgi:hypothetical protein